MRKAGGVPITPDRTAGWRLRICGLLLALLASGCARSSPPAPECAADEDCAPCGTCQAGACSPNAEICANGLDDDCDGLTDEDCPDPCQGVACDQPPADRCEEGGLLRTYLSPGLCQDGVCEYASDETLCQLGCDPVLRACLGCQDACPSGASECLDGQLRTCGHGTDGCLAWGEYAACADGLCADPSTCGACLDQPCGPEDGCCPPGCGPGADPDCPPPSGAERTVWLIHLSDPHFGDSAGIARDLAYLLDEVVPVVGPAAVVNTGDTVDLGSSAAFWADYRATLEGRVPPVPAYFEIPGNHDVKDGGAGAFLAHSQSGRAGLGLHGQTFVDAGLAPEVGHLRILRANTSDSDLNALNVAGIFGQAQAAALSALSPGEAPIAYALLAAHHPITGLERLRLGAEAMQALVAQVGARVYLCGHVHHPSLSWLGTTLVVLAASLGKTDPPGFALVSLDPSGPSARMVALEPGVAWPLVMITSPADRDLGGGNPFATPFAPGQEMPVRALAFDPVGIDRVEARLGLGAWSALGLAERGIWVARLQAPDEAGAHRLEVRATGGSGTGFQTVALEVIAP
jgi:hypothetical protein